jgi:hypothetical protein
MADNKPNLYLLELSGRKALVWAYSEVQARYITGEKSDFDEAYAWLDDATCVLLEPEDYSRVIFRE